MTPSGPDPVRGKDFEFKGKVFKAFPDQGSNFENGNYSEMLNDHFEGVNKAPSGKSKITVVADPDSNQNDKAMRVDLYDNFSQRNRCTAKQFTINYRNQ